MTFREYICTNDLAYTLVKTAIFAGTFIFIAGAMAVACVALVQRGLRKQH